MFTFEMNKKVKFILTFMFISELHLTYKINKKQMKNIKHNAV